MIKKMITAPCHLNDEPYLTMWHHSTEDGVQIWIQINPDKSDANWIRLGDLFEQSLLDPNKLPDMTNYIRNLIMVP